MNRQSDADIFLVVVRGSRSGERVPVLPGQHVLGCDATSDIRLVDRGVCDRHAVVTRTADSVTVTDTRLTNLTWVNGKRLTSVRTLVAGDEVCFGSATLRLEGSTSTASPRSAATLWVPGWIWRAVFVDGAATLGVVAAVLGALLLAYVLVDRAGRDGTSGAAALPIASGTYRTTAEFGEKGPRWKTVHTGLDFAAPEGTPIRAVASGTVISAGASGGAYGNLTKIRSFSGTEFWYAHQSGISVEVNDRARTGQVIGQVGTTGNITGPHLHLEIRVGGIARDPRDWFSDRGVTP